MIKIIRLDVKSYRSSVIAINEFIKQTQIIMRILTLKLSNYPAKSLGTSSDAKLMRPYTELAKIRGYSATLSRIYTFLI